MAQLDFEQGHQKSATQAIQDYIMATETQTTGDPNEESEDSVSFQLGRLESVESGEHTDPSYRPKLLKQLGRSIDEVQHFDFLNVAKILVLYSGGTIGMRSHSGGKDFVCFICYL